MSKNNTPDRIIRLPAVLDMVGLSKTQVYKMIRQHEFPPQVKIGRASGWFESRVQEWIRKQAPANDASTAQAA